MIHVTVDLDALADSLGTTTPKLKRFLHDYAIQSVVSEAMRLASIEEWDARAAVRDANPKSVLSWTPPKPIEHRHLVAAAQAIL